MQILERPRFLVWPLPAYIGLARISQYPNTPWTWHYLGLNPGQQCPPMFGYLLNVDSWPYWRDPSIPDAQDKARADPHNFEMVECYSTDGNAGANGHEGTDIKAPAGTPVYAAADGLVQEWRQTGLNSMIALKHCLYGIWDPARQCTGGRQWYTTYMHINIAKDLLEENKVVPQGALLGTVYDQTINSHLHFEVGHDRRSYTNYLNPWGENAAPWLGCLWKDRSLCPYPEPEDQRVVVSDANGLSIYPGGPGRLAMNTGGDARKILAWGDRLAILDGRGNLFVRQGPYGPDSPSDDVPGWPKIAEDVQDFQITEKRTAVIDGSGILLAREDGPGTEWTPLADHVRAYSLADTRVGYLSDQGELYVKQGALDGDWALVQQGVAAFQLVDNRIAYVDRQNRLYVNEGDLTSEFQLMAQDVRAFQVTNAYLAVLEEGGKFLVKEGNLRADWVEQADSGVRSFQLADIRILMRNENNDVMLKEGDLYQPWQAQPFSAPGILLMNGGVPVSVQGNP